jgi:hypothetical protein
MKYLQLTDRQRVMVWYYVFKDWTSKNIVNLPMADLARLMHVMTNEVFTGIDNSNFYKDFQHIANLKTDPELIKDLEVVKNFLLQENFQEAARLVGNRLAHARQELNTATDSIL